MGSREIKKNKQLEKACLELQIALHINKSNLETLEWNEHFINYIYKQFPNYYNEACEYADKIKKEEL